MTAASLSEARQITGALEKQLNLKSDELEVYIKGFDPESVFGPWVKGFVVRVGDSLAAQAELQLATQQTDASEVTIDYEIDWDLWTNILRHFPIDVLVQHHLAENWRAGGVDVGISSREGRILKCVFLVS